MIIATQRIFTPKLYKESILIRYIFRQCNQFCEFLANIDFPEITRRCWKWSAIMIIATKIRWVHVPMIFANCKSRVYIQPVLILTMTPFANCVHAIFQSPILIWQTLARLELSFSILTYEPHEAGWTSVWPLKYWTTASPVLLAAVVTWNVRPLFLLQWNLSWVKDKTDLSSFMAVFVRTIWSLVIPRYEVLTGSWEGGVEPITTLETRSHPPEMESCFLIRKNNRFKGTGIT